MGFGADFGVWHGHHVPALEPWVRGTRSTPQRAGSRGRYAMISGASGAWLLSSVAPDVPTAAMSSK